MFPHANPFPRFALAVTIGIGLLLSACDSSQANTPPNTLSIVPPICELRVSEKAGFSINGALTNNSVVTWSAQLGLITKDPNDYNANYIAPAIPGEEIITATVTPGPSGETEILTRNCTIKDPNSTQSLDVPVATETTSYTIVISEVMSNPCGGNEYKKYNQYVELHNYGDQPMDVGGWFLFDEGESGTPDQLVPWISRSSAMLLNPALVTNSTVIPPHGFALILSPSYPDAPLEQRMPYPIMPGTLILTVASGDALGDDIFNIINSENGSDTLTLYIGSLTIIDQVVDTYGTPQIRGPYPSEIENDFIDNFPIYLSSCYSSERINPRLPDSASNWVPVKNGSPGDGPYP